MGFSALQRTTQVQPATITTTSPPSSAASTPVQYGSWSGGLVHILSGASLTTLTWWVSPDNINWYQVYDGAGNAITSTVAVGDAVPIPLALFGAAWIIAVGNNAGTAQFSLKG